VVNYYKDS
jgi:hypothetical protein